jgi:hypothetical protein
MELTKVIIIAMKEEADLIVKKYNLKEEKILKQAVVCYLVQKDIFINCQ